MSDRFLGRYRLLHRLGVGGWAEVWSALDEETGDRVALKRLHPHVARDTAARARLRREAAAVGALDHPGIVDVLDVIETDEEAALVLEFIDGEPLSELIARDGRLDPDRAIRLVGQVAAALATAHAAGIVHRDVKPANVLVDRAGDAHLTDFGIARSADAPTVTASGDVVGTLRFMAPEVLRGEAPTPAADVWALGALAYVLLEGKPPHPGAVPAELLAAREAPPPVPRRGGAALGRLVTAALSPNPVDRPADGAAFAAALESALAGRRRRVAAGREAGPSPADATMVMAAVGEPPGSVGVAPQEGSSAGLPASAAPAAAVPDPAGRAAPHAAEIADASRSPAPARPTPARSRPVHRPGSGVGGPIHVPAPLVVTIAGLLVVGILAAGRQPEPTAGRDDERLTPAPSVVTTPVPTPEGDEDEGDGGEGGGGGGNGKGDDKGKKGDPPGHGDGGEGGGDD